MYAHHLNSMLHDANPLSIIAYIVVINAVTYGMYRYDKRAAVERRWRISESTLHTLMFIGGTIGAFAAMRILRHKNRKTSFQTTFWLLFIIQVGLIIYITRA